MSIEFRCTQCNNLLRTDDGTEGRQAQCPQCGAICMIPLPAASAGSAAAPIEAATPFAAQEASGAPPKAGNPYQSPTDYAGDDPDE